MHGAFNCGTGHLYEALGPKDLGTGLWCGTQAKRSRHGACECDTGTIFIWGTRAFNFGTGPIVWHAGQKIEARGIYMRHAAFYCCTRAKNCDVGHVNVALGPIVVERGI